MERQCNKYEAYFVFANREDYENHVLECKNCQEERIKEEKLSCLIKDSAETFKVLKRKNTFKKAMVKGVCALFLFASAVTYAGFEIKDYQRYEQFISSNTAISIIEAQGLPVDEYGFFDYE